MEHREACILLTDYVKGSLSEQQRAAVEAHVETHPECRDTVDFLKGMDQDLAAYSDVLLHDHPSADDLVTYAVAEIIPLPGSRENIADHVKECVSCFKEIQKIRSIYSELVQNKSPRRGRVIYLIAAAAAVICFGMLYAVTEKNDPGEPWSGATPIVQIMGVTRSADVPTVLVDEDVPQLPMIILWDPWQSRSDSPNYPVVVTIVSLETEQIVWELETNAVDLWNASTEICSMLLPVSRVGFGDRELTITTADGNELFTGRFCLTPR